MRFGATIEKSAGQRRRRGRISPEGAAPQLPQPMRVARDLGDLGAVDEEVAALGRAIDVSFGAMRLLDGLELDRFDWLLDGGAGHSHLSGHEEGLARVFSS
jgi:hypothetical protein